MSRRYDPKDIREIDKLCLDKVILEYWNRPEIMSFDDFFFSYIIDEFTKNERFYLYINGNLPLEIPDHSKNDPAGESNPDLQSDSRGY